MTLGAYLSDLMERGSTFTGIDGKVECDLIQSAASISERDWNQAIDHIAEHDGLVYLWLAGDSGEPSYIVYSTAYEKCE